MMHHVKSTSRHGISSTGFIYPLMTSDLGLLLSVLFKVFLVEDWIFIEYSICTEQNIAVPHIAKHQLNGIWNGISIFALHVRN